MGGSRIIQKKNWEIFNQLLTSTIKCGKVMKGEDKQITNLNNKLASNAREKDNDGNNDQNDNQKSTD